VRALTVSSAEIPLIALFSMSGIPIQSEPKQCRFQKKQKDDESPASFVVFALAVVICSYCPSVPKEVIVGY
jgi:hypothetical protein